jgi:hypothetical protein
MEYVVFNPRSLRGMYAFADTERMAKRMCDLLGRKGECADYLPLADYIHETRQALVATGGYEYIDNGQIRPC